MAQYLTFLINKEKVGIKFSNLYSLEGTLINKVVSIDGEEYISYRGKKIKVYDTGTILYDIPLKKFDGIVFVKAGGKTIGFKTEGFFKTTDNVKMEIKPITLIS